MSCGVGHRCGSCIAVAVVYAGSYSSDLTSSLGASICHRYGPKKDQKIKKSGEKMLNKRSQIQKNRYCMITFIQNSDAGSVNLWPVRIVATLQGRSDT